MVTAAWAGAANSNAAASASPRSNRLTLIPWRICGRTLMPAQTGLNEFLAAGRKTRSGKAKARPSSPGCGDEGARQNAVTPANYVVVAGAGKPFTVLGTGAGLVFDRTTAATMPMAAAMMISGVYSPKNCAFFTPAALA